MSRPSPRLTALAASSVIAASLGLGAFVPAEADDSPAPVALDDTITIEARAAEFGGVSFIDVLANDTAPSGESLEICRVEAPARGLSVAEVQPSGDFVIQSPNSGASVSGNGSVEEGATETLALLPWANRAGTYQFTYWACDTTHLTPATVTVTVEKTLQVAVRKTGRPGRLRFSNPRTSRAVVLYGGPRQERPDGRVRLAAGSSETRRVVRHAIRWVAFSPRTGQLLGEGFIRGIRLPGSAQGSAGASAGDKSQLTPSMLRAWSRA